MSEELENKEGKAPAQKDVKKPSAEKLKALQLAMEKIDKDHGKGTIMRLGDDSIEDIAVIPTGSIGLDYALGVEDTQEEESSRYTVLSHQVRQHSQYTR